MGFNSAFKGLKEEYSYNSTSLLGLHGLFYSELTFTFTTIHKNIHLFSYHMQVLHVGMGNAYVSLKL